MRWISILVLIVLAFTIATPLSSCSLFGAGHGGEALMNLDVCHSAAPALSSNGEMPSVSVMPCSSVPMVLLSSLALSPQVFTELLLASRNEQPPRS